MKADTYHLICPDMQTDRYFSVTTRRSLADIADVASKLDSGVLASSVLVKGDIITFEFKQTTVFSSDAGDVTL